ncbi:MAG: PhoH family protein [Clostridia bacterium]|nr:phosphate starvation-inducible protein PhoH [Clostridiales bacterium]MBR2303086.1 PhoH family protein [Clostridia bacterium]
MVDVPTVDILAKIFGNLDENVNIIDKAFEVEVSNRNGSINVCGNEGDVLLAEQAIKKLIDLAIAGDVIDVLKVNHVCDLAAKGKLGELDSLLTDVVAVTTRGKIIKSKTVGQKKYVDAIKKNTISFGEGPAGTGKTYLAVAMAASAYKNKQVDRIILTRPAVEAGEKLGFLPGDLQEKVNPYLRPLYDALQEMFGYENYLKLMEKGAIEIAPLAYMRGRTLNNAFVILDEAQNTTKEQMKMFLTRLGEGSKMVITGDLSQVDLPPDKKSGLRHAMQVLRDVEGIAIKKMTQKDVVRHPLVQMIVEAYEKAEKSK